MKILVSADIHCGYPSRLDDNIWSLKAMAEYASGNNIEKIIVLGDFFHNRDHLTIDVLNVVHDFFVNDDHEWILFPGNHDMFMKTSWDINSIRPMDKYARTYNKVSSFKLDNRKFLIIPFMHFEDEYMNLVHKAEDKFGSDTVLLTHIGVNNALNNSCFLIKYWSNVNLSDCKFDVILSGHFHNHQVIDDKIYYPGSPIPFRFDEGMVPHGFCVFDTDNLNVDFINLRDIRDDCPYDFITITDDMIDGISDDKLAGNKVRVALEREHSKSSLDSIRDRLESVGVDSVSWMKLKSENTEYKSEKVDDSTPYFIQWMNTQDVSRYNKDKLVELYNSISEEAEDLFLSSQ